MDRGEPRQAIVVVPGSGTGELTDLSGTLTITVQRGRHDYESAYTFGTPVNEPAGQP